MNGKKEVVLTWNDYKVLTLIRDRKAVSVVRAVSIYLLADATKLSKSKVRDAIYKFKELGYVEEGVRQYRMKSYYITEQGIEELEKILGGNVKC